MLFYLNPQFVKFGETKIPAALGLLPLNTFSYLELIIVVLLHNILEQVDLESAGFTKTNFSY
jgi:hypothetical protein